MPCRAARSTRKFKYETFERITHRFLQDDLRSEPPRRHAMTEQPSTSEHCALRTVRFYVQPVDRPYPVLVSTANNDKVTMLSYVGLGAAIMVSAVLLLVQLSKARGLQR